MTLVRAKTALDYAILHRNTEIINALLDTPYLDVQQEYIDMIINLPVQYIGIFAKKNMYVTPTALYAAASKGYTEAISAICSLKQYDSMTHLVVALQNAMNNKYEITSLTILRFIPAITEEVKKQLIYLATKHNMTQIFREIMNKPVV